ncbi:epidermal retinol dehydrogenase 2-like protein [Euroglyphus maynei]|uniref:Epidermal retinol dehydrogenase 2-like protein n=1 Tax=Euroglyphus maynei TaxID=6958 RepID=A0A1Y3B2E7_EURMA|nr:epidermal retinol dehydrogenase 2-like protein [Euroglyphus maynei]
MEVIYEFFTLIWNIVLVYFEIIKSWFKSKEQKNLSRKVIVITGSAHGIGKEMSIKLNRLGARLALIDINQNQNDELIEQLKLESPDADIVGYACDLTDGSEVDILSNIIDLILCVSTHQLQYLTQIDNAGIVKCAPFNELEPQDIRRTFDVNVFAHFWLIRHFLPSMIERRNGHIVAISSACGLSGKGNLVDYCAAKHAVVGLMTALDCELRLLNLDDRIQLTTICPLTIATGMFKRPSTRFSFLMPILTPIKVAQTIIDMIREPDSPFLITIPAHAYWMIMLEK